jgi:peptide-methionine (S)-S-oxide reductase
MNFFRFLVFATAAALASTPALKADSIVLGGGCFWCLDAAYKLLPGVTSVTCGYAGGKLRNPSYEDVCTGETGHAEVVKIDYDPAQVSLAQVLGYFWNVHNPVQVGGQGHDMGPQYRSIILYASPAQKDNAEKSRTQAQKRFEEPITTEIVPLKDFWPAEEYHQDYFKKNPTKAYCALVIRPKVEHLKQLLKEEKERGPAAK